MSIRTIGFVLFIGGFALACDPGTEPADPPDAADAALPDDGGEAGMGGEGGTAGAGGEAGMGGEGGEGGAGGEAGTGGEGGAGGQAGEGGAGGAAGMGGEGGVQVVLESLRVTADSERLVVGQTARLIATGIYSDGAEADLTADARWSSDGPALAIGALLDDGQEVVALEAGGARVQAEVDGVVGQLELTAEALAAVAVRVEPEALVLPAGGTAELRAFARFNDDSEAEVTRLATWRSINPLVATVSDDDADRGTVTGVAPGSTRVTATYDGRVSSPVDVEVGAAALAELTLAPADAAGAVGETVTFTVTGRFADGALRDLTAQAEFAAEPALVLFDGAPGQARLVAAGEAAVTATVGDVTSAPSRLTVAPPRPVALAIEGGPAAIPVGGEARFTASATLSDGSRADVTDQVEWRADDPTVVRIEGGVATGLRVGATAVSAVLDGLESPQLPLLVEEAPLDRIEIEPAMPAVVAGRSVQLNATAVYADGARQDVTAIAAWDSDDPALATVGDGPEGGRVSGLAAGDVRVTATLDGVVGAVVVMVSAAELDAVVVTPIDGRLIVGETLAYTATATFSDGATLDVSEEAQWTIGDEAVATVSNRPGERGVVTALVVGETTVRATYDGQLSAPAAVVALPIPNVAPEAVLVCPDIGREGIALDFSGEGSRDVDGAIVSYTWAFGDGETVAGPQPLVSYTYGAGGRFTVELTVEDDEGARATARCDVEVTSAAAPTVRFIRPQGVRETTQGEVIEVLVDARAGAGRNIAGVALLLDGEEVDTAEQPPYEMQVEIPLEAETGATLRLVARAVDDTGEAASSAPVLLDVRNAPPIPLFVAVPTDLRRVTVDAGGVTDDTTPGEELEVRWDWEDDGQFDTPFDTVKTAAHEYPEQGVYTIRMQVRDNVGQLASLTRTVEFADQRVVFGDIESQVWSGTIIITGDVRLLPGHTLTVTAGTQVQFAAVDQDGDGLGDYDLTINGQMLVQGEPDRPVVFTVFGEDDRAPRAWNRVRLDGDMPSEIRHAIAEYAEVGFQVHDGSVLEDILVQRTHAAGIYLIGSDAASLTRITALDPGIRGLLVQEGASATVTDLRIEGANTHGITGTAAGAITIDDFQIRQSGTGFYWDNGGQLTLTDGLVEDNSGHGVLLTNARVQAEGLTVRRNDFNGVHARGSTRGLVTRSHIVENRKAGVAVLYFNGADPTLSVVRNNIFGNAIDGSTHYGTATPNLRARDGTSSSVTLNTVGPYTPPAGHHIVEVSVSYDITAGRGYGRLLDQNSAELARVNRSQRYTFYGRSDISAMRVEANQTDCCGSTSLTLDRVVYQRDDTPAQLVVLKVGGSIDARENYFGVYPDVLSALALSSTGVADIQGFVGVPFDDAFDTGPYYGGRTIDEPVEWSGVVYVSGDVTTAGPLTVAPGTEIRVAPVDQNRDGVGDYYIRPLAAATIVGTADEPIVIRADSDDGQPADWDCLRPEGPDSEIRWVRIHDGLYGIYTSAPGLAVSDLVSTGNRNGTRVLGGAPTFERAVFSDNANDGLQLAAAASVTGARIERNAARGLQLTGAAVTVEDARIADNGFYGVEARSAGHTLSFVDISDNADQGLFVWGNGGARVTDCIITFNGGAGVLVRSDQDNHAGLVLNRCNVFGNANVEGGVGGWTFAQASPNLRARDGTSSSVTSETSGVYQGPQRAFQARITFGITAGRGTGQLQTGEGVVLASYSRDTTTWAGVDAASLRAFANQTDCCGTSTMTLSVVRMRTPGIMQQEMAVGVFAADRVDARNNYWGVFPNVQDRIHEAQVGSTDFTGFQPFALEGVGPRVLP